MGFDVLEQQDKVSAKGFIYGYSGSVLLLIFSLILVQKPDWFGISDPTLAPRITFVLVGLWWFGFAQITYKCLPNNVFTQKPDKDYIWKGFLELKTVLKSLTQHSQLKYFLIAFFFLSVGVQTIVLMAGIFGSEELGLPTLNLILTILIVQLVAIVGAYLFSRSSSVKNNLFVANEGHPHYIYIENQKVYFSFSASNNKTFAGYTSNQVVQIGTLYHLIISVNLNAVVGEKIKIYVNGTLQTDTETLEGTVDIDAIGVRNPDTNPYGGIIQEVQIYDSTSAALTANINTYLSTL